MRKGRRTVETMTHRQAPTVAETVTAANAAADAAVAEVFNLCNHLAALRPDSPAGTYAAARSAAIIAGLAGQISDQLRELAGRQSRDAQGDLVDQPVT